MQGCFEILALNGSFTIWQGRISTHPRLSLVSVMLAKADGRVFGGGVAGPLIAAGPTQVMFLYLSCKVKLPNYASFSLLHRSHPMTPGLKWYLSLSCSL